jgi:hypothetical protein
MEASMQGVTVVGVVAFEERGDGVTVYHIKLSNGDVLKRRYNDIRKMWERLPEHEKKRLKLPFPGKTGFRKATEEEKNKRLAAFDRLMKTISGEPALTSSPAFHAFLTGVKAKKPGKGGGGKEKAAKDGKKAMKSAFKRMVRKEFKETEIESFDDFFGKVKEPLDTINDLSEKVADAVDALSKTFTESFVVAAGVADGDMKALLAYYMKEMKAADGKIKFKLSSKGEPKIKFKGNKHAKHILEFIETMTDLITAIFDFVTTAPDLVEQVTELAQECADFPMKVKDEAPGMNPMKIPGAIKKTTDNVKYLGGVPGEFKEFYENVKQLLSILQLCITETFGDGPDSDGDW